MSSNDSEFIQQLKKDITVYKNIYSNAKKFIEWKQLKKISIDLEIYFGVFYLIKNNSILEINSRFCSDDIDLRIRGDRIPYYKCSIDFHNLAYTDIKKLTSADSIIKLDKLSSMEIDRSISFIKVLESIGFEAWGY